MQNNINLPILALVISVLTFIISGTATIIAALVVQKGRADGAVLLNQIIGIIKTELSEYVRRQEYRDYVESHAKEHTRIDAEIIKLREYKHTVADPLLRKHDTKIEDIEKSIEELKR